MQGLDRAEGELVVLRPLTPADATERYLEWFRNPDVTHFLEAKNLTRKEVVDYMESGRSTRQNLIYAICDKKTMLHIGNVKIGPISWKYLVSDLVTFIGDTEYWGRGYARDAIRAASWIAFEVLGMRKLSASIHSSNHGSLKAYVSGGFEIEARLAGQFMLDGEIQDKVFVSQFNPRTGAAIPTESDDEAASGMDVLGIVQARMSSTRLPGKVLKPLAGKPSLIRMIERIQRSKRVQKVVIATSNDASDDAIEKLCEENGIECSRGSLDDVLDRFYRAASAWRPRYVVRMTGDCPLIDPELIDRSIEECVANKADYASNALNPTYPDGLDVEVMRYRCLREAWIEATLRSDREHVTPFIHRNKERYRLHDVRNDEDLSALRWTVDEESDCKLVQEIFDGLYEKNPAFSWRDVLSFVEARPELKTWNSQFTRNEGLKKSIEMETR